MRHILFTIICFAGFYSKCLAQRINADEVAMEAKADSLYYKGDYKNAALQYNYIFKLENRDSYSFDFYRSASANAHAGNASQAIYYLNLMVISNHLKNMNFLLTDANFLNIHNNRHWQKLTNAIKEHRTTLESTYGKAIKMELLEMNAQNVHQKKILDSLVFVYGHYSNQAKAERLLAKAIDSVNFVKIKSIIHVYGYLGPTIIGTEANQIMFNVIYNRSIDSAKKFIPIVWEAFLRGDAPADNYAALVDKVALRESNAQIYGTIVERKGASYYRPPILNNENVDSLRRKIGLPPLREYLKQFGIEE